MRIKKISVYSVDLPYPGGTYHLSKGRTYTTFDNTVVAVETDTGITGWGETCPFGSNYIEASPEGARTAISLIAPHLLGRDPRHPEPLYQKMDIVLVGHGYAISALDMAFWDILGKSVELPLCDLWGGRFDDPIIVSDSLSIFGTSQEGDIDTIVQEDIRRFKQGHNRIAAMKATGNIARDIEIIDLLTSELGPEFLFWVDANSGWRFTEALQIGLTLHDRNIVYEQPCAAYEECRQLRQRIPQSIMLDEIAVDLNMALQAQKDGLLDRYAMKTARVGGLTKARKIRDFCVELGVPIHFQCTWGAELSMAGMLYLSQSTPEHCRTEFWPLAHSSTTIATADGSAEPVDGFIEATHEPGLGVQPRLEILGSPIAIYQ